MIAVQSENGELVKVLKNVLDGEFGFHQNFGFISKEKAMKRVITRKRQFFDFTNDEWLCSFKITQTNEGFKILPVNGCEVKEVDQAYQLSTPMGLFHFSPQSEAKISTLLEEHEDENHWINNLVYIALLLVFILVPVFHWLNRAPAKAPVVESILEPITVKIQKEVPTVKIEQVFNPTEMVNPNTKVTKSHRAVQRDLGFLGMVGSKDVSKVVGGVPQNLKVATAGAGAGGDAGSGGELLTGLGKGLKKTTVGNTGVQGLGGVGTKGAGGGLGGYGNTLVASGEGKGISAIAVSSNDMVIEGGLSKYVINATIAKYLSQVRRCYETELKTKPELQGLVEMSFEINGSGKLNFAKVSKTTLENANVENCISTKMMDWQFPQPKGGVNVPVKYPFMLRPVGM